VSTNSEIQIYPNPANEFIAISLTKNLENVLIEIIDVAGKLVADNSQSGATVVNIANLANGVYFCKVSSEKAVLKMQKVVVVH
jgi:hypothetical protein